MRTEEEQVPSALAGSSAKTDSTKQKRWFNHVKRQLSRENLDRRYFALSDHIWLGMHDIWWALTHPHKAIARNTGQLTAVVVVCSVFGTIGYVIFGEAGTARVNLEEPSSLFKVAADNTIRPALRAFGRVSEVVDVTVTSPDEVEEYNGDDYRR